MRGIVYPVYRAYSDGLYDGLLLIEYDAHDQSSVLLGSIQEIGGGNAGGIFVPFAITKDNKSIILNAVMGDPGAGGGAIDFGYAMIPVASAKSTDQVIKSFPYIATRSAHFYDSFSKVVYVDEGEKTPHEDMPGPSNDGAIMFRSLDLQDNANFYSTALATSWESGGIGFDNIKSLKEVLAGGANKILEESDTSYQIISLDEAKGILKFQATKYTFPKDCPRADSFYCRGEIIDIRSIALP